MIRYTVSHLYNDGAYTASYAFIHENGWVELQAVTRPGQDPLPIKRDGAPLSERKISFPPSAVIALYEEQV